MKRAFFFVFFIFLFPLAAVAQEGPYWQYAAELTQSGQYAEALEELDRLLIEKPDETLLLRMKGICLIETGKVDAAVTTLTESLQKDPESIANRFYLAQAYTYGGKIERAIRLLKEVQAEAPESLYAERAESVVRELENLAATAQVLSEDQRWNVALRAGGEFDDNVIARSRHVEGTSPQDAYRFTLSSYLEYRVLDQTMDSVPATLGVAYAIYQSWHERLEAFTDFDVTSQTGRVFLRKGGEFQSLPYRIEITGHHTNTRLGNDLFSDETGFRANLDLQWLEWATVSPSYSFAWRNFENDTVIPNEFSRDGFAQSLGLSQQYYLFENSVILGASYSYRWNETDGSQLELESHDLTGSLKASMPWKFHFSSAVSYKQEDYIRYSPFPRRLDDVYTVSIAVSRPLWRKDLLAEFSYTYTYSLSDSSALDFSEYNRTVYALSTMYYF